MKTSLAVLLSILLTVTLGYSVSANNVSPDLNVTVARFSDPKIYKNKIRPMLRAANIQTLAVAMGLPFEYVFVDDKDSGKARFLLAKLIIKDKLDCIIIGSTVDNKQTELQPQEVIDQHSHQNAEQGAAANP